MAKKLVEAVKKAVKTPAKEKAVCPDCKGSGLLDPNNLCTLCDGSGKK